MKPWKNDLDERQEQALLKIEHVGCWLAFWGLLLAQVVQLIAFGPDAGRLAGEWVVFMILALYIAIACIKNGIWDRHFKADPKTNLLFSLAASVASGLVAFAVIWKNHPEKPMGSLTGGLVVAAITLVCCFLALTIATSIYKKRRQAMEAEPEE